MFQLHELEAGKKKKPKKWRKNHPITDKEFLRLIKQIRNEQQLSDKQIMQRVKDYYGTPFTPDFKEVTLKGSNATLVDKFLSFFWVIFLATFFAVTISCVSGTIFAPNDPETSVVPPQSGDNVVYDKAR